jgi:RNA polymerase primary sigma factor
MHIDYKSPLVREIRDRQRQDASREQLLARIDAAERLIASVDVGETYQPNQVLEHLGPAEEVSAAGRKIPGRDLVHDLRLLVEDLSDAAELPADAMGE